MLPVVLVVVGLLALTLAGFMFFVRAELSAAEADRNSDQAKLAAESGLQEVIVTLRKELTNPKAWYDAPDRFRHMLVWSDAFDRQSDPVKQAQSRKELLQSPHISPAWRFSVVAENYDGLPNTMRYGITPESAKLNLNAASEAEIERLVTDVCNSLRIENAPELVACLLDWLDEDDDPRPGGAESEYYSTLTPAYKPKNGPLDSIEELLLIKGWSAAILYGEDTNRNGILDTNENDGDASFPTYDNADGILDRGLAPYITIYSREPVPPGAGGAGGGGLGGGGLGGGGGKAGGGAGGGGKADGADEGSGDGGDGSGDTGDGKSGARQRGADLAGAGAGADPNQLGALAGDPNDTGATTDPNERWGPHIVQASDGTKYLLGRVNVNVAPERVLRALDGLGDDAAARIVAARAELTPDAMKNMNWLASAGVDVSAAGDLQKRLTTAALQFHVEVVGYADHIKLGRRLEWIIEMFGPVAQVLYYRDLTALGFAWPIDDDSIVVTQETTTSTTTTGGK